MRATGMRKTWIILGFISLFILLGGASVVVWRHYHQKKTTLSALEQKDALVNERLKQVNSQVSASLKIADRTKGIKTTAAFEKQFKTDERPQAVLLTLKTLVADKDYSAALIFVTYIEQTYPKVADSIDFDVYAYRTAKGLSRGDLMSTYKQKAEATLRAQKVIGDTAVLDDSYFTGGGQSGKTIQ